MTKVDALLAAVSVLKLASQDVEIQALVEDLEKKVERINLLANKDHFAEGTVFSV